MLDSAKRLLAAVRRQAVRLTCAVKSDHCSIRNARMSRTEAGNHDMAVSASMASIRLAMSSSLLT